MYPIYVFTRKFSVPLPYQIAWWFFCHSDLPSGSSSAPEERMQPPVVAGDPSSSSSRERSNSLSHAQQAGWLIRRSVWSGKQCCRSVPLTNGSGLGSGPGSCYFRQWPSRWQLQMSYHWFTDPDPAPDPDTAFFSMAFKFFCLLLFDATFTSFFKDKKSWRSHKTATIKVFLTISAWLQKDPEPDPDPYLVLIDPDPGGPKTFGSGSTTQLENVKKDQNCAESL